MSSGATSPVKPKPPTGKPAGYTSKAKRNPKLATDGHRIRITSMMDTSDIVEEVDDVQVPDVGVVHVPVVKGFFLELPMKVQEFIAKHVDICQPKGVYICDGSEEEEQEITEKLVDRGLLIRLPGMENCFACRTDPKDVARVESKTFVVTPKRSEAVPTGRKSEGVKDEREIPHGMLGRWMNKEDMDREMDTR